MKNSTPSQLTEKIELPGPLTLASVDALLAHAREKGMGDRARVFFTEASGLTASRLVISQKVTP